MFRASCAGYLASPGTWDTVAWGRFEVRNSEVGREPHGKLVSAHLSSFPSGPPEIRNQQYLS
jgi:hypothetical protein